MKRILKAVLSVIISAMLLPNSFIVYAIDFDAEEKFNSVFVVLSGNSLGSGFALGEQCVITNAHVIQDSSNVEVSAYDGKIYSAVVYCKDEMLDIAVLSVPDADFQPLRLENTSNVKIGEDVFAIGAPNGMSYTLTKGTLSSNKRILNGETYLQIDAALNEGNSGGPLLDSNGSVIGMNTMKMSNSEGIGLAIPIERIEQYMNNNEISVSDNGAFEIPRYDTDTNTSGMESERNGTVSENTKSNDNNNKSMLISLLCISVIGNIIMLLLMLLYRSKWKRIKAEQSERTDFEIDILE